MSGSTFSNTLFFRRIRPIILGLSFLILNGPLKAQHRLGGSLEGGILQTISTDGEMSEDETNPAFGLGFWWAPGDLLVKPSFVTDGSNHALGFSFGARFFQRFGLSGRATFIRDQYQNLFLDNQQELQALDRNQWFTSFGADISFFPGLRTASDRNSWVVSAGFGYISGGTFVINAGVGYVWKTKDRQTNE